MHVYGDSDRPNAGDQMVLLYFRNAGNRCTSTAIIRVGKEKLLPPIKQNLSELGRVEAKGRSRPLLSLSQAWALSVYAIRAHVISAARSLDSLQTNKK